MAYPQFQYDAYIGCARCKGRKKKDKEGRYIKFNHGRNQRWVCFSCEPETSTSGEVEHAAFVQ